MDYADESLSQSKIVNPSLFPWKMGSVCKSWQIALLDWLKQGWASVSLDVSRGLVELRALYEHLQAKILERIVAAQREEAEREIASLKAEAGRIGEEAGEVPF